MANTRRKRRSADERSIAAARLFYKEGLSDEAIRRTALYQTAMDSIKQQQARRKMLREDRIEAKRLSGPTPDPERGEK